MTLPDSDKRLLALFVIAGLLAVLIGLLGGCRGAELRKPDRWSLHLSQGLGDDYRGSGTATPPPHGGTTGSWSSDGEAVVGVGAEWDTDPPKERSVLYRLDRLQDAVLSRPTPEPALVSIPRPDADPALLEALKQNTRALRRLEETIAALPAQEPLSSPESGAPESVPEEPPPVPEAPETPPEPAPEPGSVAWGLAKAMAAISAVLALAKWWPEVWGGILTAVRFLRREP